MMKWFKLTAVTTAFAFGAMMTGCGEDNPLDPDPEIDVTFESIENPIQAGTTQQISGDIETGDVEIDSWTWDVETSTGGEVDTNKIKISNPPNVVGLTKVDLADYPISIITTAAACDGDYKAVVTINAGDGSATERLSFSITGGVDCSGGGDPTMEQIEVTLGSFANTTHGSSLDADDMTVYGVTEITPSLEGEIDAWFSNTGDDVPWLMAPSVAAEQQHPPKNWSTKNSTLFDKVSVDVSTIQSQSEIDALWNQAEAKTFATMNVGDEILIKTNQGNTRLVSVISVEATDDGTAVLLGVLEASM
jgi:hypothetical protein